MEQRPGLFGVPDGVEEGIGKHLTRGLAAMAQHLEPKDAARSCAEAAAALTEATHRTMTKRRAETTFRNWHGACRR